MKALFGRKIENIEMLKRFIKESEKNQLEETKYKIIKEVELSEKEFEEFKKDFYKNQPWITKDDGGINKQGYLRCIRVKNSKTEENILVNSEGYDYPRYVGIEI